MTDETRDYLLAWVAVVTDPEWDRELHYLTMELERPWPDE